LKVKDGEIVRRFHSNPDSFRLALTCGPNATRCQALVDELTASLVKTSERVDLSISDLSDNPARLHDEANSASLFGDKRYIILRLNSGEAVRAAAAIENLLDSDTKGDPVFVVAAGMAALPMLCSLPATRLHRAMRSARSPTWRGGKA